MALYEDAPIPTDKTCECGGSIELIPRYIRVNSPRKIPKDVLERCTECGRQRTQRQS